MSTLLEKPIRVRRTIITSSKHARAIEDPARAKILKILYNKQLSAEQILDELKKTGYTKALTTIRHHLDILKVAGLIEITKIQETRGAITKFYATSTKLLDFETPEDFDSKYSKVIKTTSDKMEKLVKTLSQKTIPKSNKQKIEDPNGYQQYVLMEILNRAMTNVLENSQLQTK
jgi:Fe2+ or Zn2+ uptake regulation protein